MTPERRAELIASCREMLDFLEANPEFELPIQVECDAWSVYVSQFHEDVRHRLAKHARMMKHVDKQVSDVNYELLRKFGAKDLKVYTAREAVCEKVMVEKTVTVEEWRCPTSLLSLEGFEEVVSMVSGEEVVS